jgi:hypothetical protein
MTRLPTPGGDDGAWGSILNDFLSVEHNSDGTLKKAGDITDTKAKADAAVQPTRTINGHALDSNIILTPTDIGAQPAGSYATAAQGATADSAVQPGDLAAVATSGSYTDLTSKPTLATVATSGDYTDLTNKPTVPTQFNPIAGTNVSLSGTYPNITFNATPGAGVTDLGVNEDATTVTVTSSTGADATIPAATTAAAGVLTAADKTKLNGVAAGAEANVNADWNAASGDAQILNKPALGTAAAADTTDFATAAQGTTADSAVQPGDLAVVATTGSYTDLTNKPSIPAAQVNADWDAVSGVSQILNKPSLAPVATSGSYADLADTPTLAPVATSGSYADLTGKPVLAAVATSGDYADLTNKPSLGTAAAASATDFATAAQGAEADSAVQPGDLAVVATSGSYTDLTGKPNLATVATSGSYTDLTNKPSIPAAQVNADWNSASGVSQILNKPSLGTAAAASATDFATAAQGAKADSAVQPGDLAVVATTGSYTDLIDKPTLGTAAAASSTDFATAAQGAKADSAVQPTRTINGHALDSDVILTPSDIGAQPAGSYATAAQGAKADTALQPATGLTVINTGGDANYPRPAGIPAGFIKWISTVAPVNALAGDDGYGW